MPKAVLECRYGHMATPEYSFRLNASYAPRRDWKTDITHLPPFLLIAGTNDEAFQSEAYEPTMAPLNGNGTYRLVSDKTNLEIPDSQETAEAVVAFVRGLGLGWGWGASEDGYWDLSRRVLRAIVLWIKTRVIECLIHGEPVGFVDTPP
ncbi:MAG: hypothetical protein HLUCCO17_15465 [Saliniramus fredricksonii]|uniref:Uncharacterized protein n=1 Tax=Saliniramus fredricksonii TaxID=1653334 RepID=A0A0P8A2B4_9HYPH|nr:MAG: hypothetical protein HLUCCO17_15465 [Saliniramus fredricksonii]